MRCMVIWIVGTFYLVDSMPDANAMRCDAIRCENGKFAGKMLDGKWLDESED